MSSNDQESILMTQRKLVICSIIVFHRVSYWRYNPMVCIYNYPSKRTKPQ